MTEFAIDLPKTVSLPILGTDSIFPVRRVCCIGRIDAAHLVEMGHDPDRAPLSCSRKTPGNLDPSGSVAVRVI